MSLVVCLGNTVVVQGMVVVAGLVASVDAEMVGVVLVVDWHS